VGTSNPVDFTWLQADPALPVVGWPDDAALRAAMARFAAAGSEAERQAAAGAVQAAAAADVPYLPLGQYRQQTAYRAVLRDVLPAGVPLFWNLRKG
jgi:peptide/nickel transport system substrate-binding protein